MADNFRAPELHKAVEGRTRVIERGRGGGESTSNVQSLRSLLLDTNLELLRSPVLCLQRHGSKQAW